MALEYIHTKVGFVFSGPNSSFILWKCDVSKTEAVKILAIGSWSEEKQEKKGGLQWSTHIVEMCLLLFGFFIGFDVPLSQIQVFDYKAIHTTDIRLSRVRN
jgi:hypothetical protein